MGEKGRNGEQAMGYICAFLIVAATHGTRVTADHCTVQSSVAHEVLLIDARGPLL